MLTWLYWMGLCVSLATVYLGEQMVMIFFMIVGWVHGMNPAAVQPSLEAAPAVQFGFRRILS